MQKDGFLFSYGTTEKSNMTLKIEFEDTDKNRQVSKADQVLYAETIDQGQRTLAWMEKLDEDVYRALYRESLLDEDQRYTYMQGIAMPRFMAEPLAEADSTIIIMEGLISDGARDKTNDLVFLPENQTFAKSAQPLLNKVVDKFKMGL